MPMLGTHKKYSAFGR